MTNPGLAPVLSPVRLPRAATLTEALLAPTGPGLTDDVRHGLTERLDGELRRLAPGSRRLTVTPFLLRRVGWAGESTPFRWSARTARRSIGLAAVRACLGGRCRTPAEAVAGAVADLAGEGRRGLGRDGSLGRWLAGLPDGGLGAVRGEATTWATELLCAVEWDRLPGAVVGPADQWWDSAGVGLRGRADLRVLIDGPDNGPGGQPGQPTALLTVVGGWPGPTSRTELGLAALVAAATPTSPAAASDRTGAPQVYRGVPARVAGWWPECGRAVIAEVDRPLLEATVAAVVGSVRAVVTGG